MKLCFFSDIRAKVIRLKKMGITSVTKEHLESLDNLDAQEE